MKSVFCLILLTSAAAAQSSGNVQTNLTLNGGILNGTVATGAVASAGGTTQLLSAWLTSFIPTGGAAADLGPAYGPILGVWPNLYFAPSPAFSGTPTVSGAAMAQMQFTRGGSQSTFIGAAATSIGILSSENLPIVFANNGYQPRIYVDPVYGNVGIGTMTPGSRLDVASQSILIEQRYTPATSSSSCTTGMISWDFNYVYVCVTANTWKRTALGSF
ncbi:hypothetical protein [Rhodopila sp.]|uniref:hypothetical protein n=1 Tax=Rhodopila sp. TaxID=2480087 RepID=UPI003D0F22AD